MFFFFFFQAEDGIRDTSVTGVQTCALPILTDSVPRMEPHSVQPRSSRPDEAETGTSLPIPSSGAFPKQVGHPLHEIGRASCRERVESREGAGPVQKKKREQGKRSCVSNRRR